MKVAIMQPYFLPYIGYFQLISTVDKFVIYDDVNFIKRGWINRNNILVNSQSHLFSIPLENASQNKLINEIFILQTNKWKIDLLKTLNSNYKKALYFEEFYPILETIINNDIPNLEEFIFNSITEICRYLGITTEIVKSSGIKKNNELRGEDKIIELCQILGATDYINPLGGRELYTKSRFTENKLNLHFIKSNDINYKQYKNDFVPFLSIVDVLMFNGVKEVNQMLNQFELL